MKMNASEKYVDRLFSLLKKFVSKRCLGYSGPRIYMRHSDCAVHFASIPGDDANEHTQ